MWYEEGNNEDYFFFIFDEDVMKTEYDILEDAVIYYQPKKTGDTNDVYLLIGQLVGMATFTQQITGTLSSILNTENMKFAAQQQSHYIIFLGTSKSSLPDDHIEEKLCNFVNVMNFYHGSIERLLRTNKNHQEDFLLDLDLICSSYLSFVTSYGDAVQSIFNIIPKLKFQKSNSVIYMKITQILESCQRKDKVLCGCIFSEERLICTQLSNDLIHPLLLLKPNQTHYTASRIFPGFECPFGVRLFRVYLTRSQYNSVLHQSTFSPYVKPVATVESTSNNHTKLLKRLNTTSDTCLTTNQTIHDHDAISENSFMKSYETVSTVVYLPPKVEAACNCRMNVGNVLRTSTDDTYSDDNNSSLDRVPVIHVCNKVATNTYLTEHVAKHTDSYNRGNNSPRSNLKKKQHDKGSEPININESIENNITYSLPVSIPIVFDENMKETVPSAEGVAHVIEEIYSHPMNVELHSEKNSAQYNQCNLENEKYTSNNLCSKQGNYNKLADGKADHNVEHGNPENKGEKVKSDNLEGEKVDIDNLEGEKVDSDKLEDGKVDSDNLEGEKGDSDNLEGEKVDSDNLEDKKIGIDNLEGEKVDSDNLEDEKVDSDNLEVEKVIIDHLEGEKVNIDNLEDEKVDKDNLEDKRVDNDNLKGEKDESDKLEVEKVNSDNLEGEKVDSDTFGEKVDSDNLEDGKVDSDNLEDGKVDSDKLEGEKVGIDDLEVGKVDSDNLEGEKVDNDNLEGEKVDNDNLEGEMVDSDNLVEQEQAALVTSIDNNEPTVQVNNELPYKNNKGKNNKSIDVHTNYDSTKSVTDRVADYVLTTPMAYNEIKISDQLDLPIVRHKNQLDDLANVPAAPILEKAAVEADEMVEVHLYLQAHSTTMLVLLMQHTDLYTKASIKGLSEMTLPLLGDVEAQVKSIINSTNQNERKVENGSCITYDLHEHSIQGNTSDGVKPVDRLFVETINQLHYQFKDTPQFNDVTLKTNSMTTYAHQSLFEEIYFQPRGNYRPTQGAPNNTDTAWRLDQRVGRKLDKTKMYF